MKKKVIQYKIDEPCHENWDAMTPMQQGRFCSSCAKPVMDFTRMTDMQVMNYMSTATGSVCGRMTNFQLNRNFTQYDINQSRASFSLRSLVLGTALSKFCALNAEAQGEVRAIKGDVAVEVVKQGEVAYIDTIPAKDSIFSGTVFDYIINGAVTFATVTIYDEQGNELSTAITNENGEFHLPLIASQHPFSAVVRKEEYLESVYFFAEMTYTRGVTVDLSPIEHIIMGKMIYIEPEEENKPEKKKDKE
jgi:hypothetical protein